MRELLSDEVIATDLERFATQQQPDGGWRVGFAGPGGLGIEQ